jgi:anti-sigma factor RsiW
MKNRDRDLLARALLDELSPTDRTRFEARLAEDEELRVEWASMSQVRDALTGTAPRAFDPGFSGAVMDRVAEERATGASPAHSRSQARALGDDPFLSALMMRHFRRLLPAGLALALVLATYNVFSASALSQSPAEAMLGLEPVTLASAYSLEDLVPGGVR